MCEPSSEFELVALKNGGSSLRWLGNGETFHPVVGPMSEARTLHVDQQRLVERARCRSESLVVWDVGLGAAANALAVVEAFAGREEEGGGGVDLHSFDRSAAPLGFALEHEEELGYLGGYRAVLEELLESAGPFPSARLVHTGRVRWWFHVGDFEELVKSAELPAPDAVLYDPYSVAGNRGMWTLEHLRRVRAQLREDKPCLLSNYTRSTSVRVTLLLAGFYVGLGQGVGEKDQTTVASNVPGLLERPLGREWLKRVRASTRGAPLRAGEAEVGAIGASDWESLEAHPQWR